MVNKAGTLRRVESIGETVMWILLLEAGVALFMLVFVVWWTMFAGRKPEQPPQGIERRQPREDEPPAP
jgi:hypothetical protein